MDADGTNVRQLNNYREKQIMFSSGRDGDWDTTPKLCKMKQIDFMANGKHIAYTASSLTTTFVVPIFLWRTWTVVMPVS